MFHNERPVAIYSFLDRFFFIENDKNGYNFSLQTVANLGISIRIETRLYTYYVIE